MEISDSNVDPVLRHDAGQTAPSGNGESSTQGQQHLESPKRQTRSQTGKRRNPADDVQPNKRLRPKDPPVPPPEDVPPSLSTTFPSRGPRPRAANLPVPVPNLTKKSRGRRVPTAELDADGDNDKRTYACPVHGCGKCFHRGEHLKRHIRSIHTHDKPFQCTQPGCEKFFNRHDNLLQHLKVHTHTRRSDPSPPPLPENATSATPPPPAPPPSATLYYAHPPPISEEPSPPKTTMAVSSARTEIGNGISYYHPPSMNPWSTHYSFPPHQPWARQ